MFRPYDLAVELKSLDPFSIRGTQFFDHSSTMEAKKKSLFPGLSRDDPLPLDSGSEEKPKDFAFVVTTDFLIMNIIELFI